MSFALLHQIKSFILFQILPRIPKLYKPLSAMSIENERKEDGIIDFEEK
jgi:hypothetical protein